ncbi:hypothetical protein QBC33DRAFT_531384 [Phialemonium atrogriseum]|uniref:Uncharacterized protein n=1 Tax=Phialemonium atrogriseum TaxID=1093897 RepID=A0AAJ0FQY5_9PEZI|nr:uncharacterized protein QBC33DRAFT_531384 [Phialemonium atrogriseum]KAK1769620.1 hypothetical protein QBC33DRAFT_531384 [Phialemonium atrogriseum]
MMEQLEPSRRSASHGAFRKSSYIHGSLDSRAVSSQGPPRARWCGNENTNLVSRPSTIASKLEITTETRNISVSSNTTVAWARPVHLPLQPRTNCSDKIAINPLNPESATTPWLQDDRQRLPSYRNTNPSVVSTYNPGNHENALSYSYSPLGDSGRRSYSMTSCDLRPPNERSTGSLRCQLSGLPPQPFPTLPRSTRLRRHGLRPLLLSPAQTRCVDHGGIVGTDRISHRTVRGSYNAAHPPSVRQLPLIQSRSEASCLAQALLNHDGTNGSPDPPSTLSAPMAFRGSRIHDYFEADLLDQGPRTSSITSIAEAYQDLRASVTPQSGSFYYDYTEDFDNTPSESMCHPRALDQGLDAELGDGTADPPEAGDMTPPSSSNDMSVKTLPVIRTIYESCPGQPRNAYSAPDIGDCQRLCTSQLVFGQNSRDALDFINLDEKYSSTSTSPGRRIEGAVVLGDNDPGLGIKGLHTQASNEAIRRRNFKSPAPMSSNDQFPVGADRTLHPPGRSETPILAPKPISPAFRLEANNHKTSRLMKRLPSLSDGQTKCTSTMGDPFFNENDFPVLPTPLSRSNLTTPQSPLGTPLPFNTLGENEDNLAQGDLNGHEVGRGVVPNSMPILGDSSSVALVVPCSFSCCHTGGRMEQGCIGNEFTETWTDKFCTGKPTNTTKSQSKRKLLPGGLTEPSKDCHGIMSSPDSRILDEGCNIPPEKFGVQTAEACVSNQPRYPPLPTDHPNIHESTAAIPRVGASFFSNSSSDEPVRAGLKRRLSDFRARLVEPRRHKDVPVTSSSAVQASGGVAAKSKSTSAVDRGIWWKVSVWMKTAKLAVTTRARKK